ncbi:hypothetical protein MYX76_07080 [Desulfobacterota bacterium AH_259_B03_O07]|nr:hypothetical protein [Desulfobacterota bacterium AH_259_B03_O07]
MDMYGKMPSPPTHPNSWYFIVRLSNELKTKNLLLTSIYEMFYNLIRNKAEVEDKMMG